jgi:two-component system phosphate regulon sensor histidine kinase PhoR
LRFRISLTVFAVTFVAALCAGILVILGGKSAWIVLGGAAIVLALISAGISYVLTRRLLAPLNRLSGAAARLALGDLSTPIPTRGGQEVYDLAKSLENARHELDGMTRWLTSEKAWAEYLVDSMNEGIITLDGNNRVTFANRAALELIGVKAAVGQAVSDLITPSEADGLISDLLPSPGSEVTIPVHRIDGRTIELTVRGATLKPPMEDRARSTYVLRDISADKAMQRLQSYFLGNLSHELQTPLASLRTSAELLVTEHDELSEAEHHKLHTAIYRGILRLEALIDNLLASASVQAGRFKVKLVLTDLGEPIEDAMLFMGPLMNSVGLELELDLPDSLPLVCADPRRVTQVLVNFLSNAIKYTPSGTVVRLSARPDLKTQMLRVNVADSGPGIPPESRALIFSRFGRLDTEGSRKDHGAGLGLYIAKTIIESHGGEIGVENGESGGSVFWFTLPLATEDDKTNG